MPSGTTDPKTVEEALALLNGQDLDAYRRELAARAALWAEAETYMDLPPENWPSLTFNWDLSLEGQRYALDGVTDEDFKSEFPAGFRLGWVAFPEFDAKLCHFSRRDGVDELWNLGFKSSLARVIAHLAHGLPITPPLIGINSGGELCIRGGHHRYAVAKVTQCDKLLPIYFEPSHHQAIDNLVAVKSNP